MNDLNSEQISYIMFHQLSEDEKDFMLNNYSIAQSMLLVGNKDYRDYAITTCLNYIQFFEKLDKLHNQTVCNQDTVTH